MTPETITIPASITIPKENFEVFAERLGYFSEVEDPNDISVTIPNPESKLEFVQRVFKDSVAMPWLLQFIHSDIDRQIGEKLDEEKSFLKQKAFDELSPAVKIG